MSRVLTRICACATAFCVPFAVTAQSEGTDDVASAESVTASAKSAARHYHALVKLAFANDNVSVKLPRQTEFKPAKEGKFYPNGAAFRVTASGTEPVVFEFGPEALVKVSGNAEFGTREVPMGGNTRTVTMVSGQISVSLPRTMPTGLFTVAYPNFTVKDLAGESSHELIPSGDGDEAVVHVITGMLAIEGAHYNVARMSAADRVRIRTTGESLFTSLRGESGDYKVTLDQGVTVYRDPIAGTEKEQARKLDYSLTPQCAIKIFRKRSQIGGRMAVSVMTFDPAGEIRNRYTFAEGTSKVNFGEEIVRVQDISFKTKSDGKKTNAKEQKSEENAAAPQEGTSESTGSGEGSGNDSGFGAF
ncbi:MAG: hypothetical protein IKK82_02250 [Kiritimatiellae bacterium]|nr:hypothetical protein [Kiritimatiellia bacterium]